jgi:hypothetical protein
MLVSKTFADGYRIAEMTFRTAGMSQDRRYYGSFAPGEPPTTAFGISLNKTASGDARRFAPATNCIADTVQGLRPQPSSPEDCQWGFACKRI